jgi:hypothetical protein
VERSAVVSKARKSQRGSAVLFWSKVAGRSLIKGPRSVLTRHAYSDDGKLCGHKAVEEVSRGVVVPGIYSRMITCSE